MLGDYDKCIICGERGIWKQTEKGFICDECEVE